MWTLKPSAARWRSAQVPVPLLVAVLLVFAFLTMRVISVESPIMASDEYAYVAAAKFSAEASQIEHLDPQMQQIGNKIYPKLYSVWSAVSPERAELVGRIFNSLLFVVSAFLLFAIFTRLFERKVALAASLLYLAMPFSTYAIMLLPEVEFQASIYALACVIAYGGVNPALRYVALAALASAVSYLVKPHALAAIAACMAYFFIVGWGNGLSLTTRFIGGTIKSGVYAIATLVSILVLSRMLDDGQSQSHALVASFYQSYIDRLGDAGYWARNLAAILDYVAGHLWVLALLFAPGLAVMVGDCLHWLRRDQSCPDIGSDGGPAIADTRRSFSIFLMLALLAFVTMVAAFTTTAGEGSDFEKYRLHGRYLECLLPFLLAYSLWAANSMKRRYVAVLASIALVAFVFHGRYVYRLYPWDYPDIFGFYSFTLPHWQLPGTFDWTVWVMLGAGLVCWAAYFFEKIRFPAYIGFLAMVFAMSHTQVWRWLAYHSEHNKAIITSANAIKDYLGAVPTGSGLVLAADRYGETSYLLMALGSLQHVRSIVPGVVLSKATLPEAVDWVIAPAATRVDLPGAAELRFGNQKLYLLDGKYQWPIVDERPAWDGKPIVIDTSAAGQTHRRYGFNDAEQWGSWTRFEEAYIDLPAELTGKVRVSFASWVPAGHPDAKVRVGLGQAFADVTMTGNSEDYSVVLNVAEPAHRLLFQTKIVKHNRFERGLGVAVSGIRIESSDSGP